MKSKIFRTLAGLIVIASIWAVAFTIREGDFSTESLLGMWSAIVGFLFIVPTFGTYVLRGEKAANRVLINSSKIMRLPERWFDRLVRKHVEVPPEFDEVDQPREPNKIGNMGGSNP